ncbi:DUF885 domain-containing protein [Pseudoalteromonas ulvae]|uniref:DUF885 domain-containing protein n=1 Tax=Pseudoalteromonas ulvae TaxID=107327 RepID=A0A244CSQ3_PSEDV|nr:DUF885 domain-containing protein [Pseudoalteromonas ulvae]OUL58647.1 hypothetical protein B1199_10045 [Pseudoalteromonas ulvae]
MRLFNLPIKIKISLLSASILVAVSGCNHEANESNANQQPTEISRLAIDRSVNQFTQSFMRQQPALATSLGLPTDIAGQYQDSWPDYSPAGMQQLQTSMTDAFKQLSQFDLNTLNEHDRLHLGVNQVIAQYYIGDTQFKGGYIDTWGGHLPYIVSQIAGPLIDIPKVLQDQHVIDNEVDARNYLHRLSAFARLIADVKTKVLADAEQGIILPKVLFPNTLGYLEKFIALAPAEHPFISTLASKLSNTTLSSTLQADFTQQAIKIVTKEIYPAFADITATMRSLQNQAPLEEGIWAQPNGEQFYQHEILYLADSTLSAEAIHNIGLEEVNRISEEMDRILKAQGMLKGSVGERMAQLGNMPQFLYEDSDAGRTQLLADLNKEIERVMEKAPSLFATLPSYDVTVKRIPVVSQDGAPGGFYNPPALDGSRAGEFSINLKDMKAQPSFSLKTLTYHEAAPGHHFQISLNMEQKDIGIMRQNGQFNAYVEGWALYSELVAYEMGMYDNDPWGNLGRLQAEVYRAARLVVDTGLHHKRWPRQKAINYFHQATGTAMSDVEAAIDRYIAWPGQALGYKLGMLKIVELRSRAQQALGERFDIKSFHDLVLLPGARPLTLLEEDVDRWIKQLNKPQ